MRALLLACFALLASLPLHAEDLLPESGVCREERRTYARLQEQLAGFQRQATAIEDILEGDADADLGVDEIVALLSGDDGEAAPTHAAENVRCEALQAGYRKTREALVWQKAQLVRLRAENWANLPAPAREGMLDLWASRARLSRSTRQVADISGTSNAELLREIALLDSRLQSGRLAYLQMLKTLQGNVSAQVIDDWLQHWRQSLDLNRTAATPPENLLREASAELSGAVHRHYRLAAMDTLIQARAYNAVRGWLWAEHHNAFRSALAGAGDSARLLYDEGRAMQGILLSMLPAIAEDFASTAGGTRGKRWLLGFEYLLGLGAFIALGFFARASRGPANRAQAAFARRCHGSRARAQLVRMTAPIPELLPWILGWLGLAVLEHQYRNHHLPLLLPLLPFARLYIVYGLLCLAGEWFLHRIASLAGSYLNGQQQQAAVLRARRFARIVILPWLLMDVVGMTLGSSLSLALLDWLTVAAMLVALGLLLLPWRSEFIRALQSILPSAWDAPAERLFADWRFVLLAPLATPFLLAALLVFFVHKGLVDYDWYRRLMARGFKLRSGQADEDAVSLSDESALARYQVYFGETLDAGEPPFIVVDVGERLQKSLDAWLGEKSEENSLLFNGERGSGKTTVLMKTCEWLGRQEAAPRVEYVEVPAKCASPEAIAALLEPILGVGLVDGPAELVKSDTDREPTVLVLDNAQNCFLRRVGGLQGWEFLLGLTRARLRNVFWVVAMNNQSWAYLGNVFGRDYQFGTLLHTRPWSQNDIRSLILSRNQLSGCKIHYDSILLSSRGPEAGNIRNAEQLYFSLLWDACRGNPLLALRLWLTSVTVNGSSVTVGLPVEVAGAALERLDKEMHFTYAALVLHENMTSEELVATTALPESRVRAALKIAFDIGLVQRSANRRYRIVPLWYPAITRLLARKNLLHE
ncbi:AAA family ATPase [Haliea sp. E17]|uniref:AAA family ATPase n=1 Tax=Haliea sp. E17 TaxID=3401576 RepID=UPI003AB0E920